MLGGGPGRGGRASYLLPGLPVQRRQVLGVAGRVGRVGDDPQDGALQRGALEQAVPHQLQVAGRVHAGAHGGARQQHALVGEQQREAAGDLDGAHGRHRGARRRGRRPRDRDQQQLSPQAAPRGSEWPLPAPPPDPGPPPSRGVASARRHLPTLRRSSANRAAPEPLVTLASPGLPTFQPG